MDYTRPSFADLKTRIATDLAAMPAVLRERLAATWAQACHGLHGHLDWLVLQTSPLTCELERLYDYAALYNVPRLLATAATGAVAVTGTAGTTLLAGAVARSNAGVDYTVVSAVTLDAGGVAQAQVRCASTGLITNLAAGKTLALTSATTGVSGTLTVAAAGLSGGADDELVDDWRARVTSQWQVAVIDGARSGRVIDYVFWAGAAHPSVTGALVGAHEMGIGSVVVRPVCNGLANRLPTESVLSAVRSYLEANAPVADVRVIAPVVRPLLLSINLVASVNTAANQMAIRAGLADLINSKRSAQSTVTPAEIDAAVAAVTPFYSRLAPLQTQSCAVGELFVLSPIVWA